jgi:hypothetical protein
MRNIIFSFFIVCILNTYSQSNTQTVLKNMAEQEVCWNNGDIKGFMKHYWHNDSLRFIGKKGINYGWQTTFDNYIKSYPDKASMGKLKFRIEFVKQLSETSIYIIGNWDLEKDKPVGGHFTLLWQKLDGRWVIVADHTS